MKITLIEPKIEFRAAKIRPRTYMVWDAENNVSVHEYPKPCKEKDVRNALNARYKTDLFKNYKKYHQCFKDIEDSKIFKILESRIKTHTN
jgi:ADP-heptose:LPS heptosyltransferase